MIAFPPLIPGIHEDEALVAFQGIDRGVDHRPKPAFDDVGPFREALSPPTIVFRDRMELRQIEGDKPNGFRGRPSRQLALDSPAAFERGIARVVHPLPTGSTPARSVCGTRDANIVESSEATFRICSSRVTDRARFRAMRESRAIKSGADK